MAILDYSKRFDNTFKKSKFALSITLLIDKY